MPSGGLSADASQGDALLPAQFFLLARRREPVTVTRAWRSSLLAPSVLSYPISQHRVSGQRMVVLVMRPSASLPQVIGGC